MAQLPNVSDQQLRDELVEVIHAGWRLVDRPQRVDRIQSLLLVTADRLHTTFYDQAKRLLEMLDAAFLRCAELPDTSNEPLLTDQQSLGLRILFGTYPDYRIAGALERRKNAATYLTPPGSQKDFEADTIYRHQENYAAMALDCLKRCYGQEPGVGHKYQLVQRTSRVMVGSYRRTQSVTVSKVIQALIDGVDEVKEVIHPREPHHVAGMEAESFGALPPPDVDREGDTFTITLHLPQPLARGETLQWDYARYPQYVEDVPTAMDGAYFSAGSNDGFQVDIAVQFDCEHPAQVWAFDLPLMRDALAAAMEPLLKPDAAGVVYLRNDGSTDRRRKYGIAWRW